MRFSSQKVIIYLSFLLILIGAIYGHSNRLNDTPYQYPVVPGSLEWKKFESRTEMVEACQIPEDILERLSTPALLQTILDYPFLSEMLLFYRTPSECEHELGFWHIADSFNGLQEFMKRKDALSTLEKYGVSKNLDSNSNVLTIIYRNIIKSGLLHE